MARRQTCCAVKSIGCVAVEMWFGFLVTATAATGATIIGVACLIGTITWGELEPSCYDALCMSTALAGH